MTCIQFDNSLKLFLKRFHLFLELKNIGLKLYFFWWILSIHFFFEYLTILKLYLQWFNFKLFFLFWKILNPPIQLQSLYLNPSFFSIVLLSIIVLLIFLPHNFAWILLLIIKRAYLFNGGINKFDKFHLELELAALLDRLIVKIYFIL